MATLTADSLREAIEVRLGALDCAGDLSCHGLLRDEVIPGLQVFGLGGLGTPLYDRDVQALKQQAHQAPFGKGEATIVDTSVRNTWEIDAAKVSLSHPRWKEYESTVLDSVCTSLGVSGGLSNVRAELYKLLIYEQGAHFNTHKDSEKAPGMFATMVICLPSLHRGGDVVVSCGSETRTLSTAGHSQWNTSYLAWYADVTHEVLRVESGAGVVLTYNLIYTGTTHFPRLAKLDEDKAGIRDTLQAWQSGLSSQQDLPKYLAYPFAHGYSKANLHLSRLQRRDRDCATCMLQVSEELGFSCFLAILDKTVTYQNGGDVTDILEPDDIAKVYADILDLQVQILLRNIRLPESIITKEDSWEDRLVDEDEQYTGNSGVEKTYSYKQCESCTTDNADLF